MTEAYVELIRTIVWAVVALVAIIVGGFYATFRLIVQGPMFQRKAEGRQVFGFAEQDRRSGS